MLSAGLLHGQEKSGKTKKIDKIQVKMRVFEKSQDKIKKNIRFCEFKFTKFLFLKPSIGRILIKSFLKWDYNNKIFLEFFKIT